MPPNRPLRFRATPEVHAAAAQLQARGVNVGDVLGAHILDIAQEENPIAAWAKSQGLSVRRTPLWDKDAVLLKITTNGHTLPPTPTERCVVTLCLWGRGAVTAGATMIRMGDEPLSVDDFVLLPSEPPADAFRRVESSARGRTP